LRRISPDGRAQAARKTIHDDDRRAQHDAHVGVPAEHPGEGCAACLELGGGVPTEEEERERPCGNRKSSQTAAVIVGGQQLGHGQHVETSRALAHRSMDPEPGAQITHDPARLQPDGLDTKPIREAE